MIEISRLGLSLGQTPILQNISFGLPEATLVAVMGPSGCGKSTLLKGLIGVLPCSEGELKQDNQPGISLKEWNTSQSIFSLVPQSPLMLPWKNALENILLAAPADEPRSAAHKRALELLERVELSGSERLFPWQLSQGMAARISLARTMMLKSKVLVLDEPFAAIDATTRFNLQRWMLDLVDGLRQSAVLVTHDPREAILLADEVVVLNGKPATVRTRFNTPARSIRRNPEWIFSAEAGALEQHIRRALEKK
ncbi:MAG: ABC transporter ATP-binding protein [Betaproteobacteria bacterium]|nr:ABC transporter ATP-binding protein [Betaproteobacteria bacterium]